MDECLYKHRKKDILRRLITMKDILSVLEAKASIQPGGQSIVDRLLAAKNTIAGQALAKVVCKATTEEMLGPKRKHLDCER